MWTEAELQFRIVDARGKQRVVIALQLPYND